MRKQNLQEYIEYSKERFTKRIIFKEGESTVFILNFAPGQSLPNHKHPGTNVYLLVVEGSGTFAIDGNDLKVSKNDVVLCTGDEELAFVNDSERNSSVYVMLNKIPDEKYATNI